MLSDNVGLRAAGAPGQQGAGERVEGASGQEHQRGCLQLHPGGAGRRPGPLLPADSRWRAQTNGVGQQRTSTLAHMGSHQL